MKYSVYDPPETGSNQESPMVLPPDSPELKILRNAEQLEGRMLTHLGKATEEPQKCSLTMLQS